MAFPQTRLRRLRRTSPLRDLVRETRVDPGDLVLPLFVESGLEGRSPIGAMPGVDRLSISEALDRTLNTGNDPVTGPLLHLAALAVGWGALARLAIRRFG